MTPTEVSALHALVYATPILFAWFAYRVLR
jgi:hypothetical protein